MAVGEAAWLQAWTQNQPRGLNRRSKLGHDRTSQSLGPPLGTWGDGDSPHPQTMRG